MNALNLETRFMMLLHPRSRYVARFGFGPSIRERLARFSFDTEFAPDISHAVVTKKEPTLRLDVKKPSASHRMSAWYTAEFSGTRSVLLVSVLLRWKVYCNDTWFLERDAMFAEIESSGNQGLVRALDASYVKIKRHRTSASTG